ncbi:MAG TPA: right-handed parallel beta-helix repeat-containing protein, partial [Rubricoccaceae bacterium]|nr:right-handed parallel beta-helix repeat-containing protein [Rubricoccaceae bacterium]
MPEARLVIRGLAGAALLRFALPFGVLAAGCTRAQPSACPAGTWRDDAGRCVPAEEAFVAPGGRVFWVDQRHPSASDANPGTRARPWRTISRAAARGMLRPGDAVLIRSGVYREAIEPREGGTGPDRRVTYAAYPADTVVVTGADPLPGPWTRDGAAWRHAWTEPLLVYDPDPVFRREIVVADGDVLRAVVHREDLRPGTFWVDGSAEAPRALIVRFPGDRPPTAFRLLEAARRPELFRPLGADPFPTCGDAGTPGWLRVVGLTFRHAANYAQNAAYCAGHEGGLVEDVTVEWANGRGMDGSGRGHVFRRFRADHNGQLGLGGSCDGCRFEDGALVSNNWKGYDPFWEAGGAKFTGTRYTVFRRLYVADNDGPGLWLDGDNDRNTIEGCRVERNAVAGIMLELNTTRTLVQHNVVEGTRFVAWSGTGLLSQAASENVFAHNTVRENEGSGLWLRLDPARRAPEGSNAVWNNLFAGNATHPAGEGREVMIEGESPAHLRTNRFDG